METCSRTEIMRWGLAMHPKDLWCLIFRVLPKLLCSLDSLLKKFQKDEHDHQRQVELEATLGTLPELSQDILMSIFATLEIPDLVRAGAVCSSWRVSANTSLAGLGQYKKHQTPCLLYSSESAGDNVACLYSLAEKRAYRLTVPEPPIRSRFLIGSSGGWLVTVDEVCELHFVNPISGQQISLPSVITIEHVTPIFDDSGSIHKYEYSSHSGIEDYYPPWILNLPELRERLYYKAFVFYDTFTESYIVVIIHNPHHQISFARLGDDNWTWMPPYTDYLDCIYKDGLLYAVTSWGKIHTFDLSDCILTAKIIMVTKCTLEGDNSYMIQAPWGDLLHILRSETEDSNFDPKADPMTVVRHTGKIEIYKIDIAEEKVVEFNCLHDHVLFLGHNRSLCLRAEEYPSLKANHAYFTDDSELWLMGYKKNRRDIGVLNLDNNNREELFSPQLWSNWPTPIWITPKLTKMKFECIK